MSILFISSLLLGEKKEVILVKKRGECILGPIIMFSLHVGRPLKQELRGSIEEGESELICHLHRWRDHCADKNEKIAEWTATQQSTRKSCLR